MSDYAVILAARMGSNRLPGKVLSKYIPNSDMTNLEQIIRRWKLSRRQPDIIVFTPTGVENNPIAYVCQKMNIPCYFGSDNVMASMNGALWQYAPDARWVARALADNPLVDVGLADARLDVLSETGADGLWYGGDEERLTYAATTDIWSRAAWDRIVCESVGVQLEHPGLYFWDNMSKFSIVQLPLPMREYLYPFRTELDEPRDLDMFKEIWRTRWAMNGGSEASELPEPWPCIQTMEALDILMVRPDIAALNARVPVKTQTQAEWRKGMHWSCKQCGHRIGSIVAGDFEVRCPTCGKPQKFYASPPPRKA